MGKYFSTFITGFQTVIEKTLKKELKDISIELLLDGLVVYRTKEPLDKIKGLRFLNNTFILFHYSKGDGLVPKDLIKEVTSNPNLIYPFAKDSFNPTASFRVIASQENQIVSLDKNLLEKIESLINRKLRLEVNRSLPDMEVWFLTRREGYGFVGLRITKTPNYEKTLHKGELRPELANLMCLIAEVKSTDIVLDPFAGYGSIPLECATGFQIKQIIASDNDKKAIRLLENKFRKLRNRILVAKWDALNIKELRENSINKIVTDPPWGFYDSAISDLKSFYEMALKEFQRVLKHDGLMIILTAQKEIFEEVISELKTLTVHEKYDTLVSGKKAAVYKIHRNLR